MPHSHGRQDFQKALIPSRGFPDVVFLNHEGLACGQLEEEYFAPTGATAQPTDYCPRGDLVGPQVSLQVAVVESGGAPMDRIDAIGSSEGGIGIARRGVRGAV